MTDFILTYRSLTLAQKAARQLLHEGIPASVQRTPPELSEAGCSNAVKIRMYSPLRAIAAAERAGAAPTKIYTVAKNGALVKWTQG